MDFIGFYKKFLASLLGKVRFGVRIDILAKEKFANLRKIFIYFLIFVKPGKNLIFLKNGKNSKNFRNRLGKPEIFSKSRIAKWTSLLDSSGKIWLPRNFLSNSETVRFFFTIFEVTGA